MQWVANRTLVQFRFLEDPGGARRSGTFEHAGGPPSKIIDPTTEVRGLLNSLAQIDVAFQLWRFGSADGEDGRGLSTWPSAADRRSPKNPTEPSKK